MLKKITATTSLSPLGAPRGKKLFKISGGAYNGRMVALVQTAANTITLFWADHPYRAWSAGQAVATDTDDKAFDAAMDAAGNIRLVYPEQTTGYLVTRLLTFSDGVWTVGSLVTIFNVDRCYDPSLVIRDDGTLYVGYARLVTPNRDLYVKTSTDGGQTWGSGVTDPGDLIVNGGTNAWLRLVLGTNDLFAVYSYGGTTLALKSLPLSSGSWGTETVIHSGTNLFDQFDASVSSDGRLGVVFQDNSLRYREFDGVNWSVVTILDTIGDSPQLLFHNTTAIVLYLTVIEGVQRLVKFVENSTGQWSTPQLLDNRAATLDYLILYEQSSQTYEDLTLAASDTTAADMFHSFSGALLKSTGDIIYAGMSVPFRYLQLLLSTAGAGGTVTYSYWDGSTWRPFTPDNGLSHLTASVNRVVLWPDYAAIPDDWQKMVVSGKSAFWIRIETTGDFTTPPIGSFISAVSEITPLICRR